MSGICGLFNFDGIRVTRAELAGMLSMLEARGPEGNRLRLEGVAGLGHTKLTNTPEAGNETQPFADPESGCSITADLRIDNREELLGALGLKHRRDSTGDARLVLAAYLLWGERCVERLLGDFAFAIFDPRERKLFCARDGFGMRPLYYFHDSVRLFAFASSPRAILTLPQIPYRLNEGRIVDYLVPELEWSDYTSTFFEDVHRLPPGHTLSVTEDRFEIAEYYRPEPQADVGQRSDDEWKEAFLEAFTKAVDARLRVPEGRLGSMLSGGMDSGSVVAIATQLLEKHGTSPLPTYSAAQPDGTDCAETRAIHAATTIPGIQPNLILPENVGEQLEELWSGFDEPFDGNFVILKAIYLAARDQGRSIVLDGAAGDVILSEGSYIPRLMRSGHAVKGMKEIVASTRFWGTPVSGELVRHFRSAYTPDLLKRSLRPLQHRRSRRSGLRWSLVAEDYAQQVGVEERFERLRHTFGSQWNPDYADERISAVRPNLTAGRERYGRLAASMGQESADPFLDRRLVELSARLPGHLRLSDGWPKSMLRELMADRLPEVVRCTRAKPHLGGVFNTVAATGLIRKTGMGVDSLADTLAGRVDRQALDRAWADFESGEDPESLHHALVLGTWLRENANRPVVGESHVD